MVESTAGNVDKAESTAIGGSDNLLLEKLRSDAETPVGAPKAADSQADRQRSSEQLNKLGFPSLGLDDPSKSEQMKGKGGDSDPSSRDMVEKEGAAAKDDKKAKSDGSPELLEKNPPGKDKPADHKEPKPEDPTPGDDKLGRSKPGHPLKNGAEGISSQPKAEVTSEVPFTQKPTAGNSAATEAARERP